MTDHDLARFVVGLPKAELHLHLVGAASVPTVLELARRHPGGGVPTDEAALRAFYEFTDFAHFIEVYIAVNSLVRGPEDVEALVVGAARDLAAQNVRYAELTVTPDSHVTTMGMPGEAVAEALTSGRLTARAEHGVELAWVFDIPGELGLPSGERTIDWVEQHAPEGSVGFGLGGPEAGVGRPQFADVFARARAIGLHSVPHAGETTGPETIWDAVRDLGAERIGHGIAAAHDPALLAHLAEHRIALEVCPTSNLRTRAVESIEDHPFATLRDAGVVVTLGSDDPGMFDTTLQREYEIAHDVFGLDREALVDLAEASVDASFAPDDVRWALSAEIDAYRPSTATDPSAP
ncbi:MAG: adenosine deaminase [Nocardioidaceae bacterium]|nr:adenosine deaminase [Nocardioidaceae bacterium]